MPRKTLNNKHKIKRRSQARSAAKARWSNQSPTNSSYMEIEYSKFPETSEPKSEEYLEYNIEHKDQSSNNLQSK